MISDEKTDLTDSEYVAAVEIKCPYPKSKSDNPYYEIPDYYIGQCLGEMKALNVSKLLFVCYIDENSTLFEIYFDDSLWDILEQEADDLYGEGK